MIAITKDSKIDSSTIILKPDSNLWIKFFPALVISFFSNRESFKQFVVCKDLSETTILNKPKEGLAVLLSVVPEESW